MIKTKKIASGYYEGRYNYVDFTIQKVSDLSNSEVAWYWQIGNEKVNDWYRSKFQAIQAVKSYIAIHRKEQAKANKEHDIKKPLND